MREGILNNKLTKEQLKEIDEDFPKDEDGKVRIEIDFDDLYVSVNPEGF